MSDESGLRGTWRERLERQAFAPGLTARVVARLAPKPPRAAERVTAPTLVPQGRHLVSVVVPCYNYGRFLPAAVHSVLSQEGVDVEVIIVDDLSTDDSVVVARDLAQSDERVTLLENPRNVGHVRSFNAGWAASTGEFVVKLDADDLLAPGALSRAVALFEARPNVALVYGHPHHFSTPEPPPGRIEDPGWTIWRGVDWLAERCARGSTAITNPEMVLRSSLLRTSGPMNPDITYAPDMEISLRMATLGDVGFIQGADQALHRDHPTSMSVTEAGAALVDLNARLAAFENALSDEHPDLLESAKHALARHALRHTAAARDRGEPAADSADLLEFARSLLPDEQRGRADAWPDHGLASGPVGKPARYFRKARRAAHDEVLHTRWMLSGV